MGNTRQNIKTINQPMNDRKINDASNMLSLIGWITATVIAGNNDLSNKLPQLGNNLQNLFWNKLKCYKSCKFVLLNTIRHYFQVIQPMTNRYAFRLRIYHVGFVNPAVCVQRVYFKDLQKPNRFDPNVSPLFASMLS